MNIKDFADESRDSNDYDSALMHLSFTDDYRGIANKFIGFIRDKTILRLLISQKRPIEYYIESGIVPFVCGAVSGEYDDGEIVNMYLSDAMKLKYEKFKEIILKYINE